MATRWLFVILQSSWGLTYRLVRFKLGRESTRPKLVTSGKLVRRAISVSSPCLSRPLLLGEKFDTKVSSTSMWWSITTAYGSCYSKRVSSVAIFMLAWHFLTDNSSPDILVDMVACHHCLNQKRCHNCFTVKCRVRGVWQHGSTCVRKL